MERGKTFPVFVSIYIASISRQGKNNKHYALYYSTEMQSSLENVLEHNCISYIVPA